MNLRLSHSPNGRKWCHLGWPGAAVHRDGENDEQALGSCDGLCLTNIAKSSEQCQWGPLKPREEEPEDHSQGVKRLVEDLERPGDS